MNTFALRAFAFWAGLLFIVSNGCATETNSPPRLTVELRDGSRVVGTSVEKNFKFHSALLGELKLAVQDIRSAEYVSSNAVKLTAANGDLLELQFADSSLALKTDFGKVVLATDSIRKLSVASGNTIKPTREGLIGFWPGNGTAADLTGGSNGTLMHGANFATGPAGQAFNFETAGSFVKIPKTSALDPGEQVSVEFWMKPAAANAMQNYQGLVTSDFYGVEISNGYGGTMGVNFFLGLTANQPSRRATWSGQFFNGLTSVGNFTHISDANGGGAPVTAGQWHLIAATYDGSQLRLYIDGQVWGQPMSRPGSITPMLPGSFVAIGSEDGRTTCADCAGNRYFKGQMANVAIYNRALTSTEVQEDFKSQKPE